MKILIAKILYKIGRKPHVSTFVDEETITMGYGKLDFDGLFQFPLPLKIIRKKYGTTKWSDL